MKSKVTFSFWYKYTIQSLFHQSSLPKQNFSNAYIWTTRQINHSFHTEIFMITCRLLCLAYIHIKRETLVMRVLIEWSMFRRHCVYYFGGEILLKHFLFSPKLHCERNSSERFKNRISLIEMEWVLIRIIINNLVFISNDRVHKLRRRKTHLVIS